MLRATTACTFSTSQLPKVVRTPSALYILTSKCASRHNGVHFFDIATSKSGPTLVCFVHFDFEMCFAPQRRALFRQFSTSQLPKVVRTPSVLYIFTSKCASRHNGVQFFISHLASWLPPAALASLLSTLRSHKSLEKHSVSRRSYLFAHLHLLSSDLFSSDSSHLCFSTVHIVGSFTSKLPSMSWFKNVGISRDIPTWQVQHGKRCKMMFNKPYACRERTVQWIASRTFFYRKSWLLAPNMKVSCRFSLQLQPFLGTIGACYVTSRYLSHFSPRFMW